MTIVQRLFLSFFFLLNGFNIANAQEPFAAEILKFEAADSTAAPVTRQIMLYGSSTFRFWKTAETDCAFKDF